ncbi:MAG: hypothetical protein OXB93_06840 [Cytophagales bacterium]|nr:hypothetical protein [Cytophagales bacterium]
MAVWNKITYQLFREAVGSLSIHEVCAALGLNKGTVKRWQSLKRVPPSYYRDFARLLNYSQYAHENPREKDQFYTLPSVANKCLSTFQAVMKDLGILLHEYTFIEPSAGEGVFLSLLAKEKRIGLDIEPQGESIMRRDYLTWLPKKGKYIVIGNPPFGLRGHLALQFINHSAKFADVVAFILPPLFNSDGKGSPYKRVHPQYKLAYCSKLDPNSFVYPNHQPVQVQAIFQVWTKIGKDKIIKQPIKTCKTYIRVFSLSDGGTPSTTRNKNMLNTCDIYLPSTCFRGMGVYDSFAKLPNNRGYGVVVLKNKDEVLSMLRGADWGRIAFRGTNGSLNLRTSMIEKVLIEQGIYDK